MTRITVSPSDFGFLYSSCKRCWWLKAHRRGVRGEPLPAVFNHIAHAMRAGVTAENLREAGMPALEVLPGEWVRSAPFEHAGVSLVVNGKVDVGFTTEHGIGIADHKTTKPSLNSVQKYSRQLRGYQFAVEHPERGDAQMVDYLGLYCFDPYDGCFKVKHPHASIVGQVIGIPIEIDRAGFEKYLETLCELIAMDVPPAAGPECEVCTAVDLAAAFIKSKATGPELAKEQAGVGGA